MKCFFEFYVDFVLVSILSLLLSLCIRNTHRGPLPSTLFWMQMTKLNWQN